MGAFDAAFGKEATVEAIEAKLSEMDAATALGDEKVRLANVDAPWPRSPRRTTRT